LLNSNKKVLERIREVGLRYIDWIARVCAFIHQNVIHIFCSGISEKEIEKRLFFYETNLLDKPSLEKIFEIHKEISSVIHFAGLKVLS
jgi:UDP-glucose 4-epimerase